MEWVMNTRHFVRTGLVREAHSRRVLGPELTALRKELEKKAEMAECWTRYSRSRKREKSDVGG